MKTIFPYISVLILAGCVSSSVSPDNVDAPSTTKISSINIDNVTASEAIDKIRKQWYHTTGKTFPVCEIYENELDVSGKRITFSARDISVLDAIRLVSSLAMCRIKFLQSGGSTKKVFPDDYKGIEISLSEKIKATLKVRLHPNSEQLKSALIRYGFFNADDNLQVTVLPESKSVVLRGTSENVDIARTIFYLIDHGFAIQKNHSRHIVFDSYPVHNENDVELLSTTKISSINIDNVTASEAIDKIRKQWYHTTGKTFPVCEIYENELDVSGKRITFSARDISVLDAIRLVSSLAMCRIKFLQSGIAVTDIFHFAEYLTVEMPLSNKMKTSLGAVPNPSSEQFKEFLICKGLDGTKGDLHITVLPGKNSVKITGFVENVEIARSILLLLDRGYTINKQ